jgi:transaldolase / glucose-6-phosphate isomerase
MKKDQLFNLKEVSESIRMFLTKNLGQPGSGEDVLNPDLLRYLDAQYLLSGDDRMRIDAGEYEYLVSATCEELQKIQVVQRLFAKDTTLWNGAPEIKQSLGWLTVPGEMKGRIREIEDFTAEVQSRGFRHAVLLGMGGSSLASFVFRQMAGDSQPLAFHILDSTHPSAVKEIEEAVSLKDTLFIVASKSGSTAEIKAFADYFFDKVKALKGEAAGEQFVAITDPGTALAAEASRLGFCKTFLNYADIGGRYSVLSCFGLVPASLMGLDIRKLLQSAEQMAQSAANTIVSSNPAVRMGIALGVLAKNGRDKLTLLMPARLSYMGWWIEQLVAESTGKEDKGILPVEPLFMKNSKIYGDDRVFVNIYFGDEAGGGRRELVKKLRAEGHPVISIRLDDTYDAGAEFYRWEAATAAAGVLLTINPFDQPNVQENKTCTEKLLAGISRNESPAAPEPLFTEDLLSFYSSHSAANSVLLLEEFFAKAHPGNYIGIQAYLPETPATSRLLGEIASLLENWLGAVTTVGYGPRFLHSTGQFHKGGTNTGFFLQLTGDIEEDAAIPGKNYTFGGFINAQAQGDYETLLKHNRRVIRVHINKDIVKGLQALRNKIDETHTDHYMNINHTE